MHHLDMETKNPARRGMKIKGEAKRVLSVPKKSFRAKIDFIGILFSSLHFSMSCPASPWRAGLSSRCYLSSAAPFPPIII
jgi:hypothetical protein